MRSWVRILLGPTFHIESKNVWFYKWQIYGFWKILWSNYRKLTWVGFEPTNTEFCSDTLTDRVTRPWVQLTLRVNFVQLLQFHRLFSIRFYFGFAFVSRYVYFNRNFLEVITWVWWNELINMVFTTEGFFDVAIESWPECDLNPRPLNSVHTL